MTKAEIIEFVKNKLVAQGCKSMGYVKEKEMEDCKYRGENGAKCAIGWLIPDDIYDPKMEMAYPYDVKCYLNPYSSEFDLRKDLLPFIYAVETTVGRSLTVDDWDLLYELQRIHDNFEVSKWEEKYNELKNKYEIG